VITEIPGVRIGHWTDEEARTGCTVVVLPAGTVASGEVRGAAPGTREWALLEPGRTVDRVSAVVLAGGSAFGLAACDGVMRWCEERGIGFPTGGGPVPIVVGLVLYDLGIGDPSVRPGAAEGYAACQTAVAGVDAVGSGPVGAGTGATVGKWRGPEAATPGGLGSAAFHHGDLVVAALLAVNAVGAPRAAGVRQSEPRLPAEPEKLDAAASEEASPSQEASPSDAPSSMQATTIGVIVTNAKLDKTACSRLAQSGHDGLARALDPVHTGGDGDALVAAATGEVEAPLETVRALAAWVVEQAVADAVPAGTAPQVSSTGGPESTGPESTGPESTGPLGDPAPAAGPP
jgi:L-aminopeptidase/D-esterase-like protein